MQEDSYDYFNDPEGINDNPNGESGCCLNCPDACDGCLCFECKCKKCHYYTPPEETESGEKGICDIAKEVTKRRWKKHYNLLQEESSKKYRVKKEKQDIEDAKHPDYIKSITERVKEVKNGDIL